MDDKASIIEKIYRDPAGLGRVQNTFKEVRKVDPSITIGQVKEWIEKTPTARPISLASTRMHHQDPSTNIKLTFFPHRPERRGATEVQDGFMCY